MKPAKLNYSSLLLFAVLAMSFGFSQLARAVNGADTWVGNTSALFSGGNWTGVNNPPISGDSLIFGLAGTAGVTLTADQTAAISYAGITFNSGASAYTIGGANGITLTGNVANNSSSLETLNFNIAATAVRTFTTTAGGGDITLGGNFTGTLGGITKAGSGTLSLSGVNSFTGTFLTGAGRVNVTANSTTSSAGFNDFGNTASTAAIAAISSGATLAWTGVNGGDFGSAASASSVLYNDGTFNISGTTANNCGTYLGQNTGAYGYIRNTGTTTVAGRMWIGNFASAVGILDVISGTVTVSGTGDTDGTPTASNRTQFQTGHAATGASGINVTGGTLALSRTSFSHHLNVAGGNYTSINVTGAGKFTVPAGSGFDLGYNNSATSFSTITLASGGEMDAQYLFKTAASPSGILNFNNGILKATGTDVNALILNSLTAVYVYSGGATIDANSFNPVIAMTLLAPTADGISTFGVTGITLGGTATGYIGAPLVKISGGGGQGAAAIANFDPSSGTITSITVTAPGSGYTSAPTVTLAGGNGGMTGAAAGTATATATIGAVSSGGLTKLSTGKLTLAAGYTYTGATKVLGGTLSINSSLTLPATGGDLLVSNATLTADSSSGTAIPAANVTLNAGGTLTLTNNPGAFAINGTGNLLVDSNTVINLNYGTLGSNPSAAAINVAGSISVAGTNNVLNITGSGFTAARFPLIKYGSGTLASISGFKLGTLPLGVNAVLVNNTGNQSVDLNITSIGQTLTWYGTNSLWDINNTFNWNTATAKYLEYGTSPNAYGDLVTFDDTLYNDFINPQATNVNLTTVLSPALVTVNGSLAYSFAGAGSLAGSGSLIMNSSGSLTLLTSNSFSGGITVNAGTLIVTNDNELGTGTNLVTLHGGTLQVNGSSTTAVRPFAVTANSTIGVLTNISYQMGGNITGTGGLTKTDNGTLVMSGTNSATGALTVAAGTLNVTGLITDGTGSLISVAGINGAVLNCSGGTLLANKTSAPSISVGNIQFEPGSVYLNAGTLTTASELWLASADNDYASMVINGGNATIASWLTLARGGGQGVLNVNGGTLTVQANNLSIGSFLGAGGVLHAVATLAGGTVNTTNTASNQGNVYVGENNNGILNVMGTAALNVSGARGIDIGVGANTPAVVGIANLNGGTITTRVVRKNTAANIATFNFNGGTLKAGVGAASPFLSGLDFAYVYGGGALIDSSSNSITISQPLLAPAGYGVSSISLTGGGAGYVGAPVVEITGGSGSGATAIAQLNPVTGVITNILVTCPGSGYAVSDSLSVSLTGGFGGTGTGATVGTVTLAPNTSGGLTKNGSGTLTLSGANTYTGTTLVTNGQLFVTPAFQTAGSVVVADGAKFGVSTSSTTNGATIGNLTLGSSTGATLNFSYGLAGNPTNVALNAGAVTVNGTSALAIGGNFAVGTFPVLQYASLSGSFSLVTPRGVTATLSNSVPNNTLYAVITAIGGGIVWTGTNNVSTNLWDLNTTTNWLSGGSPTIYIESVPPGDAVIFNDNGSGTVTLNTTASPLSVTISNASVPYTFQGSGHISGSASLLKQGSGAAKLSFTGNDYAGNTVVSNGVLQLGVANTIPDGAGKGDVTVNGTLDLNTFSDTVNGLNGSGAVDTVAGGTPTLTVGGNNASSTFTGVLKNTAGTLGLTKTGTGTLTLTSTNSHNGSTIVSSGTLVVTNIATISPSSASTLVVGNVNGQNAALYQSAGTAVWVTNVALSSLSIGSVAGAYGYYNLSGGTLNFGGEIDVAGSGGGAGTFGRFDMSGGTAFLPDRGTNNGSYFLPNRGAAGESSLVNISGGTVQVANGATPTDSAFNGLSISFAAGSQTNTTTISGTGQFLTPSLTVKLNQGSAFTAAGNAANITTLNLNGGLLQTLGFRNGVASANVNVNINFNGGTVKAGNAGNAAFLANLAGAYIYNGGATIDDNGQNITIGQALTTPTGDGISSIPVVTGGAGYLVPPQVIITDGTGTGATAYSVISGGVVTGIVVTSPGNNYSGSPTVTLAGGGFATAATIGTVTTAANSSGGLIKTGPGRLLLSGANTYTGNTVISNGTLQVDGSLAAGVGIKSGAALAGIGTIGGAVTNEAGGTFSPGASIGTLTINGNLTLKAGSTNTFEVDGTTPANDQAVVGAGVSYGGVLRVVPSGTLTAGQTFTLFSGSGAVNPGNFASVQSADPAATFSFSNGVLTVVSYSTINTNPPQMQVSVSGSTMTLAWPTNGGWILQSNSVDLANSSAWFNYPANGAVDVTNINITLDPAKTNVFFRMLKP